MKDHKKHESIIDKFSSKLAIITGKPYTFMIALVLVIAWAVSGPLFHFSEAWQLSINTGTGVITFLMVFVIQQAQNKDTMAIQLKLNELIAATEGASNQVLNVEDLSDEELKVMKKTYGKLGETASKEEKYVSAHHRDGK